MNAAAGQSRLTQVQWEDALVALTDRLRMAREGGRANRIAIVTPLLTGSLDRLFDTWAKALGARRLRYEAFGYEAVRTASRLCFGRDAVPHYDLARAEVLVSFGADFLETWLSTVEQADSPRRAGCGWPQIAPSTWRTPAHGVERRRMARLSARHRDLAGSPWCRSFWPKDDPRRSPPPTCRRSATWPLFA
jgi:hypothetical protein